MVHAQLLLQAKHRQPSMIKCFRYNLYFSGFVFVEKSPDIAQKLRSVYKLIDAKLEAVKTSKLGKRGGGGGVVARRGWGGQVPQSTS